MAINKRQLVDFILLLFLFGFVSFPQTLLAASVYFSSNVQSVRQGDVFVVEAKLSSPSELINVVDGAFSFDRDLLEIQELSTGNSVFSLWAQPPVFSNDIGRVSFIGGSPNGFQGENGLILKIILLAKNKGTASLNFQDNFSVFLSDGKGTKIAPERKSFTVSVLERSREEAPKNEWRVLVKEDKIAPKFVEAVTSRDPNIFDNKYFATFFATDDGSGIAYYEVKEGEREFVKAESPYLLQDQFLGGGIQIKAVDRAQNETVTIVTAPAPAAAYRQYIIWVLMALLGIVLLVALWRLSKTKNQNES